MDVRLLGPVEVRLDGDVVDLGPAKHRCVLAALAVQPERAVPASVLVERVWGADPPASALGTLYCYLTRLRKTGVVISKSSRGYRLDTAPDQVDLHRFTTSADPTTALAEWRGEPLAGLSGSWVSQVRARLHRRRVDLLAAWATAALAAGDAADVVERMFSVLDDYPDAEPLVVALLRGLHAQGRVAEALERYAAHRIRLQAVADRQPGASLVDLHLRLLRATPVPVVEPAQLPVAPRGFVGRTDELVAMSTVDGCVVVSGMAGIGKTALALTWAHRVKHRFPDGQLYAHLGDSTPAAVLAAFQRALGATADPPEPSRYRALLTGRRVLVLLDGVSDADQVRPLLLSEPGCLVVVTSRDPLPGLGQVPLGPLSTVESVGVLGDRLGTGRIAEDPVAAEDLATLCGGLPLALRIAAAALLERPTLGLAKYAAELRATGLAGFETDDASIRPIFDDTLRRLPEPHRRVFRCVAVLADAERIAATVGMGRDTVSRILRDLGATGLVLRHGRERFRLAELARRYVAEDQDHAS